MMMATKRSIAYLAFGALVVGGVGYGTYGFASAEARVQKLCADIKPGLSLSDLQRFASEQGLGHAPQNAGISYLAENRSFGRYGCRVTIEKGAVTQSEYIFND
jgi:hypothetical protein